MTTYTLNGVARSGDGPRETYSTTTLEVVLPDAATGFVYTLTGVDDEGFPVYDIDYIGIGERLDDAYEVRLDGVALDTGEIEYIVVQLEETSYAGAILYDLYDFIADVDNIFVLKGPFPDLSTAAGVAEFEALFDTADPEGAVGLPTGDFAPGQPVALASLFNIGISQADSLRGTDSGDSYDLGRGNDKVWGRGGRDDITGGAGKDRLWGDGGNDTLQGGGGKDRLWGGNNNDVLRGGGSNDALSGGKGRDTLSGDAGRDTLNGDQGNDLLIGGGGADTIVFSRNGGKDTIRGFTDNVDTLHIDATVVGGDLTKAQVLDRSEQVGDDVVITFDRRTSITIEGFDLADLGNDLAIV